jgi:radical SAM protein with 4Fe4S-binding SPASM domain
LETNQRIIDELSRKLMYINFYFQGEPLIHSSFYELVKYAKSKKIYTATSTNAHFLDEENACALVKSGLDRLIISVDGITQKTYEAYRVHGKLDKVLQGIKNVVKAKSELKSKTPYIIYQMLVVRQNEHEVEDARKLAVELGCDEFRLKTAQVYEHEKGNQLIPVNEKYTRYRKNADGTYTLKNKLENHCWRMWQGCVFTWDGRVVPCCFDKDAVHQLGKVENGNGFNVIWRGNAYKNFRKKVLKSRAEVDICKNCSEGTEVFA